MGVPEPLLTPQEFAAISAAGFRLLGPVSCRTVILLDYADRQAQCSSRQRGSQQTDLAADVGGSFNAMLRQRHQAREQALAGVVAECRVRGGDGVIGLSLSVSPFASGRTSFVMRGIAVHARTAVRPASPFTTHVRGQAQAPCSPPAAVSTRREPTVSASGIWRPESGTGPSRASSPPATTRAPANSPGSATEPCDGG